MSVNPNAFASLPDDAQMIQRAVDEAASRGDTVVIPRRNERTGEDLWLLPRAVKLHTGSTVILENAHLRLADGAFDNMFKNDWARTEEAGLLKNRQYDIHIVGRGCAVLDGGNHNGLVERNAAGSSRFPEIQPKLPYPALANTMIHLHNAERVSVENLRVVNARYWGMTFHFCSFGRVANIHFMTAGGCPNNDGVDLRMGCQDFVIENITGYTQDDSVALTCLNDRVARVQGMDDSIHGVVIRNIMTATRCANVRLLNHYDRKLYNIIIENVQSSVETDPASPIAAAYAYRLPDAERVRPAMETPYWGTFEGGERRAHVCVRIGENGYNDPNNPDSGAKLGDTFNIIVRNVQARSQYGVSVCRTLCDSSFENIQMFGDTACAVYFGGGEFENLRFSNRGFARNTIMREKDRNPCKGNYGYEKPAAVLFGGSVARDVVFDGLATHPAGGDAFAGYGDVDAQARNVCLRTPEAKLVSGEGIRVNAASGCREKLSGGEDIRTDNEL
ncbi:MAG: hypothetical protein J5602_10450 [Clostridia bacterium]|nr:hypothetical protein [Clostridia bacterium]